MDSDPVAALKRIAMLLEAAAQPGYRSRAFYRAAAALEQLDLDHVRDLAARDRLKEIPGIGDVTERVIAEALAGDTPTYQLKLEEEAAREEAGPVVTLLRSLRGDCHTHSDWSDGGAPIEEMAAAAGFLGREYIVLTDHSPRLTVANGLTAQRLRRQLEVVEDLNVKLKPFRILTGIEVDILEDGSLDQDEELLSRLDLVVGGAHSLLRMEPVGMTKRFLRAIENPYLDVLGHCTGRIVVGRGRPQSTFDADAVFAACAAYDKAVEINSRPERLDPPDDLLALATSLGCRFAIDSDAHAPGQLAWLRLGCEKAAGVGLDADRIVNSMSPGDLLAWAAAHESKGLAVGSRSSHIGRNAEASVRNRPHG